MSTTRSDLNTRLNGVIKRSETRNLTPEQRNEALNDALVFDVANFRPWTRLVENSSIQAVDGVIRIPTNFRKEYSLHYGSSPETSWEKYNFINQTKFLDQINNTVCITEESDAQVMKIYPTDDQGVDQSNKVSSADQGLFITAGTEQLFQTLTTETTAFKGATIKLKIVGTIATAQTITLGLYATTSDVPTGSALATATYSTGDMTSAYAFYYFHLPYTTTADTEYAIVLSSDATALDATNYVAWEYSATSQTDDSRGVYDGTTYTTATGDMYFLTYSEVYNFQYSKRLTRMTAATSTTGIGDEFDEAITMLAGARLMARQKKYDVANELRYGAGGNKFQPTDDSAYGKLLIIWDEYRVRTRKPLRKMTNYFEKNSGYARGRHKDRSFLEFM